MILYAVVAPDEKGDLRVKAVVGDHRRAPRGTSSGRVVRVPTGVAEAGLIGCRYVDGKFVRPEAVWKQERREKFGQKPVTKIVWVYHDFGYGNSLSHVGRETVRWMKKVGIPVFIRPWDPRRTWEDLGVPTATDADLRSAAVVVMDRFPVPQKVLEALKEAPFVAGYYMVEGSKARPDEVVNLNARYDAVFTPSEFCRRALETSGVTVPVRVWGHGFDHEVYPYVEPKAGRPFTFLWFGDENRRKGYDLFLEAFSRLKLHNVRAWVRGPGSGNVAHLRSRYRKDERIVWDTRVTPPAQMKDLMAQADVIVCPYRGEGFNLCMLEAMASGRAAIATKWSGPLDFGTDDTVYWLEPVNKEPAQNDAGIQIGPSVEDLVKKMIWCVNHQAEVRERGRRASRMMHEKWTWERKVQEVLPYLRELAPNCRL